MDHDPAVDPLDAPVALVDQAMVAATQQDEQVDVGRALVPAPEQDVVGIGPGEQA